MKLFSIIFFLALSFNSCIGKLPSSDQYYNKTVTDKIAHLASIEPIPPAFINANTVFAANKKDSFIKTSISLLKEYYNISIYKNQVSFSDYLFNILNQKQTLEFDSSIIISKGIQHFVLDSEVSSLYRNTGFNGIKDKYCYVENRKIYLKRNQLNNNQINTIEYYMFLSQYFTVEDDLNGAIYFKKMV